MRGFFGWMLLAVGCAGDGGGKTTDSGTDGVTDATTPGDDDDDATGVGLIECPDAFTPCGGDPTGTWDVTDVCTVPLPDIGCPTLTYEIDADRSSGTVVLEAGGAYTRTTQIDVDLTLHVPLTCVAPLNCAALVLAAGGLVDDCVENGDVCDCIGTLVDDDSVTSTWTVAGTDLIVGGEPTSFCVQGDQGITVDQDGTRIHWAR